MPDWIKEWVLTELRELTRAKVAAFLLALVTFGFGWWAASRFYAERIEVMQLQVAALERNLGVVRPSPTPVSPNTVLLGLVAIESAIVVAVVLSARRNKRMIQQADADLSGTRGLLDAAARLHGQLTEERDKAVVALKDKKIDYALDLLRKHSRLLINGKKPTVTIRYCRYGGDYELAERMRSIFSEYTGWSARIDGSNEPPLKQADKFKISFDVGMGMVFDDVAWAFSDGELLGVMTVGKMMSDRTDAEHLIVSVLPSAPVVNG